MAARLIWSPAGAGGATMAHGLESGAPQRDVRAQLAGAACMPIAARVRVISEGQPGARKNARVGTALPPRGGCCFASALLSARRSAAARLPCAGSSASPTRRHGWRRRGTRLASSHRRRGRRPRPLQRPTPRQGRPHRRRGDVLGWQGEQRDSTTRGGCPSGIYAALLAAARKISVPSCGARASFAG